MPQALRDATRMRSSLPDQRRMRPSGTDAVRTSTGKQATGSVCLRHAART